MKRNILPLWSKHRTKLPLAWLGIFITAMAASSPSFALEDIDQDTIDDSVDNCLLVANKDQRDSNGDGYGNVCDADLNNDEIVNSLDLGLIKKVFSKTDAEADIADADVNGDRVINALDLGLFKQMFLKPPGPLLKQKDGTVNVTPYMLSCFKNKVPLPPDWAENGTPWVYQGKLTTKLILGNKDALVWTYSDPAVQGACVALPRGKGGPLDKDLAGIICQSATTGAACFWDNRLPTKLDETLPWKGKTLKIATLADGTNLPGGDERCTFCHRGNNVFLISPDDPTWEKVIKPSKNANLGKTFTTRLDVKSLAHLDTAQGYPRYVPITTEPKRADWVNEFSNTETCGGSCHENAVLALDDEPKMPPDCRKVVGGANNVENCYK